MLVMVSDCVTRILSRLRLGDSERGHLGTARRLRALVVVTCFSRDRSKAGHRCARCIVWVAGHSGLKQNEWLSVFDRERRELSWGLRLGKSLRLGLRLRLRRGLRLCLGLRLRWGLRLR